jgi:hypothetical protein
MATTEQRRVIDYITDVLLDRGLRLSPKASSAGEKNCPALEYTGRSIGVDEDCGIWVMGPDGEWEPISETGTIGAALEAVEFLIKDQA